MAGNQTAAQDSGRNSGEQVQVVAQVADRARWAALCAARPVAHCAVAKPNPVA
jgi:hypothetical protein